MDASKPFDSTADAPAAVNRRAFLGSACAAGALIALGIPFAACSAPRPAAASPTGPSGIAVNGNTITLDLGKSDTMMLGTAGGFLFLEDAHTLVVNVGGTMRAFTSVCTHSGCDVSEIEGDQLVCPCHGSRFGTDGQVLRGPARSALREYAVTQTDRVVTIKKV